MKKSKSKKSKRRHKVEESEEESDSEAEDNPWSFKSLLKILSMCNYEKSLILKKHSLVWKQQISTVLCKCSN